MTTRAVGIVRQSNKSDAGASPREQRAQIERRGESEGYNLVAVHEEIDVSGYRRGLARRPGLLAAVEAVEANEADVIVVAYFDRLMRSLKVQRELLERVETAGGRVLALDFGEVSNGTAANWLSATTVGMVAEYHSRITGEKSGPGQADAVERGVAPFGTTTGYDRDPETKRFVPNAQAPLVARAFDMRAAGATVREVWGFLAGVGVKLSYGQVGKLLGSRVVLGEVHFGKHSNLEAHPAIVDRDVWERVQRMRVPAGRRGKSDRLLARLGVLCCASCGSRMIASTKPTSKGPYPFYRCPGYNTTGCPDRPTIAAEIVEAIVVDAVKAIHADKQGRASADEARERVLGEAERAQEALEAATRVALAAGITGEPVTIEQLVALRQARDEARGRAEQLGGGAAIADIASLDDLTFDEWRDAIRGALERVLVKPGRGAGRVRVEPFR